MQRFDGVTIATSTATDGSMKRSGDDAAAVDASRRRFLLEHGTSLEQSVLVQLDYDSDDFCRYSLVDASAAGEGMLRPGRIADGLATRTSGLVLFLPLADCIGAVLYDPEHWALMLTHLGRHNLEQDGARRSVEFMVKAFGTNPRRLEIHFSPSAGKQNYPFFAFGNKSLAEVAVEQLRVAGVPRQTIQLSSVDTTTDQNYFSHSEFLKGNRVSDGRFAVMAKLSS